MEPIVSGLSRNANEAPINYGYSISFYDETGQEIEGSLRKSATISVPYDKATVAGQSVSISYYSDSKDAWEQTYVSDVDEVTGCIYAEVDHFSLWAPTSPPSETPSGATELTLYSVSTAHTNWFQLSWFGYFYDAGGDVGWVYHTDHGWIFPKLAADGSLWFYDAELQDWLWTNSTIYSTGVSHFLYSDKEKGWTYHSPDTANPRWFYHYLTSEWREADKRLVTATASAGGSVFGGGKYTNGSIVTLTAIPDNGYAFTEWTGDASGSSTTLTLTADSAKTITASFRKLTVQEVIKALFR